MVRNPLCYAFWQNFQFNLSIALILHFSASNVQQALSIKTLVHYRVHVNMQKKINKAAGGWPSTPCPPVSSEEERSVIGWQDPHAAQMRPSPRQQQLLCTIFGLRITTAILQTRNNFHTQGEGLL